MPGSQSLRFQLTRVFIDRIGALEERVANPNISHVFYFLSFSARRSFAPTLNGSLGPVRLGWSEFLRFLQLTGRVC